jgi:hypothetical protein
MLEISEASVNELGGSRGGRAGQIAFFNQDHRQAASLRIARDAAAIDASSDDGEIMDPTAQDTSQALRRY